MNQRKTIPVMAYLTKEQKDRLDMLSASTKVPTAERIRQGIDWILRVHQEHFPVEH